MTQEPKIFPYIAHLLQGAEVVWKPLGEVCEFSNTGVDKKTIEGEKKVRLLNFVDVFHKQYITKETPTMIVSASDKKILDCNILKGDVFITPSSEILDEIGYSATAIENIEGAVYSYHIMRLRIYDKEILHPEYLAYLFSSDSVRKQIRIKAQGITRFGLTLPRWKSIQIPLPSLAGQKEIVRILDKFTQLEAELEAELDCRKRQYEYYRNNLLSYQGNEVEWKTLDQISENLDSKRQPITSGLRTSGKIPYYGASGIVDYVEDYIFDGDFLLISEDGANLLARNTPIAFSVSGKIWVNNHAHILKFRTYEERRFIEFYLNKTDLTPYISGAAQPKLNKKNLNSIKIPIPPLEEQQRIVTILDKFDTLVNSISEGLPKEIALRRKQYEYYREKLLSFSKE